MSAEDVRCAVEAFIAEVGAIQDEVVVSYLANYLLEVLGGQPEDDALMDLRCDSSAALGLACILTL